VQGRRLPWIPTSETQTGSIAAWTLGQTFKDAIARDILMTALKKNGRFYLLIPFEKAEPKLKSQSPLENWFGESLGKRVEG
jgi:hypothetical protein